MRKSVVLLSMLLVSAAAGKASVISTTFGPGDTYSASGWIFGSYEQAFAFQSSESCIFTSLRFPAFAFGNPGNVIASLSSGSLPGSPIESFTVNVSTSLISIYTVNSCTIPNSYGVS